MNEQIRHLKNKVLDDHFSFTWTSMDYYDIEKFSEKFAQLIVKECMKLCEHESNDDEYDQYDMGMSVKAEDIKASIMKEFGVEE